MNIGECSTCGETIGHKSDCPTCANCGERGHIACTYGIGGPILSRSVMITDHEYEPGPSAKSGDDECWHMLDEFGTMCGQRFVYHAVPIETYKLVQNDLITRAQTGKSRYGKHLDASTSDDMLQMLYEELLDAAMYIRTEIERRKNV